MARIKINDLPQNRKISKEELKKIRGGLSYQRYTLTNPIVTSYTGGSTSQGDPVPTEEVSFNYGTIAWTYTESGNSGSTSGDSESDWDISSNEGV